MIGTPGAVPGFPPQILVVNNKTDDSLLDLSEFWSNCSSRSSVYFDGTHYVFELWLTCSSATANISNYPTVPAPFLKLQFDRRYLLEWSATVHQDIPIIVTLSSLESSFDKAVPFFLAGRRASEYGSNLGLKVEAWYFNGSGYSATDTIIFYTWRDNSIYTKMGMAFLNVFINLRFLSPV